MGKDWVEMVNSAAREHVPEPLVAAGILQPAGTLGTFGVSQLSPAAAMFKARKENKAAGGLAKQSVLANTKTVLLALTADKLYAFGVKQRRSGWKVQEQKGVWDRADLKFETAPGRMTTKVVVDVVSSGEHYELEATTAGGSGINDAFLAAIA